MRCTTLCVTPHTLLFSHEHLSARRFDSGQRCLHQRVTTQVSRQLKRLPPEATHVVLSSGGNDALDHQDLLQQSASSVAQALLLFADPLQALEADYRQILENLRKIGLPGMCCTIYNGWMEEPIRSVVPLALRLFNDVIANPIEPSGSGGEKIARAIFNALSV